MLELCVKRYSNRSHFSQPFAMNAFKKYVVTFVLRSICTNFK